MRLPEQDTCPRPECNDETTVISSLLRRYMNVVPNCPEALVLFLDSLAGSIVDSGNDCELAVVFDDLVTGEMVLSRCMHTVLDRAGALAYCQNGHVICAVRVKTTG